MPSSRATVSVFRNAEAILGESLIFAPDDAGGTLYWCDITAGLIHRSPLAAPADGSGDSVIRLPPPVASFSLARIGDGTGFVVSLGDRIVLTDDAGLELRELAAVPHRHDGLRMNEGKVDPQGRWVSGSMNLTSGDPDGAFYSLDSAAGSELRVLRGGLGVANGLEWSGDGSRIFFTDTSVSTIYTGDYSAEGEISNVETFHSGEPHDGLAMDVDGSLWGALYGEGRVVNYSADGKVLRTVELPAPNLTSVAFGGDAMSTLYVASARENLTEEQLVQHPLSGAVFAIETDARGRLPRTFVTD